MHSDTQLQTELEDILKQSTVKRRSLLPWWIKVFIWIFIAFSIFIPVALIGALFNQNFTVALYGIETNYPLSFPGLLVCSLFLLKAVVAYGLWTEKTWAVNVGLVDATIGIIICIVAMTFLPIINSQLFSFSFRLDIILLIPYFYKLYKIKEAWKNAI